MDAPSVVVEASESKPVSVEVDRAAIPQPFSSSSFTGKKAISLVCALESTSGDKVSNVEIRRRARQTSGSPGAGVSKWVNLNGVNGPSWISMTEEVQVKRRDGKLSSRSSKRARIDAIGSAGVVEGNILSDNLASHPTKLDSHERAQSAKQKNNFNGKRGERRNLKASMKTKYDAFSLRAGLASFNSPAGCGGSNLFGLYGLKTDVHDITKLVDDLSLNDLLEGTYEIATLSKDKGKKAESVTVNILESVRKACSILQMPRIPQPQDLAEVDSSFNEKPCLSASAPVASNGDNEDSSITDLFSTDKDSHANLETPANLLDFPLDQPKDVLEKLALPPPKNLESLLTELVKPTMPSKNAPDTRPGKQISRRGSLPPFPWSYTSSSNCKANSDAPKLSSRIPCQGRWARIGNTTMSFGAASNTFTNLESLTYNETLVPSCGPRLTILQNDYASSLSAILQSRTAPSSPVPSYELGSNQMTASPSTNAYTGEHSPTLLEAAQTLCDLATHTSKLNLDGIVKWPNKPLQKATIGHKSKANDKPGDSFPRSPLTIKSDTMLSSVGRMITSKRPPKLTAMEDRKDHNHINRVRKGPINWSTPKSSRSSPNRSANSLILKQSSMPPPPAKVMNRACNGQQKVRKIMQMNWKRESDG